MDKEEICRIIDLLSGAGYEVETISVDKFPKPPSGTFFVRFNNRNYLKNKKKKKSIQPPPRPTQPKDYVF
jgi:hypothetical protein